MFLLEEQRQPDAKEMPADVDRDGQDDQGEKPPRPQAGHRCRAIRPILSPRCLWWRRQSEVARLDQDQPQDNPQSARPADGPEDVTPIACPSDNAEAQERREDGAEGGAALEDAVPQRSLPR